LPCGGVELQGLANAKHRRPIGGDEHILRHTLVLNDSDELIDSRVGDGLGEARWESDHCIVYGCGLTDTEMLGQGVHDTIAFASTHLAHLHAPWTIELHFGANSTCIALCAYQIESYPVVLVAIIYP
jgi:hypothetical protein